MSVVVVAGGKGAPGATTTAIGLAAVWPTPQRLLIEADPDGGVLAARFGLAYEPGLVTFAAGLRGATSDDLGAHVQRVEGGVSVLCAPTQPEQLSAALRTAGSALASHLAGLSDTAAMVDVGRAWPSASPVSALVSVADVVVVVCRPHLDEIQQLGARVAAFRALVPTVQVLLIGDAPYGPGEVAPVLDGGAGEVAVDVVPVDARTAEMLNGQRVANDRLLRRAVLMRAFASLAARLAPTQISTPDPVQEPSLLGNGRGPVADDVEVQTR